MKKTTSIIRNAGVFIGIIAGSFVIAFSMHVFTLPAKFAPGGVSGIAAIMQTVTGFPASYTMLILNIPLLVLAFIYLSRELLWKSAIGIFLVSFFLQVLANVDFFRFYSPNDLILSVLAGGLLSGAGTGILMQMGASSGGSDIIGMLIQRKHTSMSISWILLSINMFVISMGGILYYTVNNMDMKTVVSIMLYSFLQVFISSNSMNFILNGVNSSIKFEVITTKEIPLSKAIIEQLGRSVTIHESRGGYTNEKKQVLVCVVTRNQISKFKQILKEVDPQAFSFAMDTREVLGSGFRSKK